MLDLESDENILYEARKHWFLMFVPILGIVVFAIIPLFIFSIFSNFDATATGVSGISNISLIFIFFYSAWLLLAWIGVFIIWTDFYLDVWIVTDKNLIDIDQNGLFNRKIMTIQLRSVLNASSRMEGLLPTLLKFGDLDVQTAAGENDFTIHGVAEPNKLKEVILDAQARLHPPPKDSEAKAFEDLYKNKDQ